MSGRPVDLAPLREAWERVLLQQFHGILPGSSVPEVYVDALSDYDAALARARGVGDSAVGAIIGDSGPDAA